LQRIVDSIETSAAAGNRFSPFCAAILRSYGETAIDSKPVNVQYTGVGYEQFFSFIFTPTSACRRLSEGRVAGGAAPQMGPVHIAIVRDWEEMICKWKSLRESGLEDCGVDSARPRAKRLWKERATARRSGRGAFKGPGSRGYTRGVVEESLVWASQHNWRISQPSPTLRYRSSRGKGFGARHREPLIISKAITSARNYSAHSCIFPRNQR